MSHKVVLVPGDGIGTEVSDAVVKVLEAAKAPVSFVTHYAGVSALEKLGEALPDATVEAILEHKIALKGPCTTPVGTGFRSVNVQLRKRLDLYGAVRPIRNLNGIPTRFGDLDMVVVRENTEGLYTGIENEVAPGVVTSLKVATEKGCTRIAHFAFKYARKRGRKKVTVFHKANILKLTDGMFRRVSAEVHKEHYSDIEFEDRIIDAGCMKLVQDPSQFDVLLLGNLYGDIISDLCAGFVGGLGVVPGANIGENVGMFEAVHGSAPDIAGKGIANPLAFIMSSVMMLNHIKETREDASAGEAAIRVRDAYNKAIADGKKTGDLGGDLNTMQFVDAVIERM